VRMFKRVKCGQILRISSADMTGEVRRCDVENQYCYVCCRIRPDGLLCPMIPVSDS